MARSLRIEYEGAIYHVMNRGDRREAIFFDDDDRRLFLKTMGEACQKSDWQVHAYCLMSNHFHLVIETPSPTLVSGMKWMLGTYTQRFNARHRMRGHLFAGRYKALLVDEREGFYLRTVCDYTHLNPVRARLIPSDEKLEVFPWTSYSQYLVAPKNRLVWLRTDRLFGEHGVVRDNARGRREFSERIEQRRQHDDADGMYPSIRRGWRFGADDLLDHLRDHTETACRERHDPVQVRETMHLRAQRMIREHLVAAGLEMNDLAIIPKGAEIKVRIARKLRQSTTLTLKEVAELLHAGSWRSLANALSHKQDMTI